MTGGTAQQVADEPLLFERDGAVARLVLNRPEAGNALDLALAQSLMRAAIACDEDPAIRCVVLTARGRLFCAGGDLRSFEAAGGKVGALIKEITAYLHKAISRFLRMDKPLVVAVHGPAAGAGVSLCVLGDIVLAARSAHFTLAYTALGVTPDAGSTWLLPRLIGLRRTQELMLLNRRVGAEEAVPMGLISRVVDDEAFEAETHQVTATLARSATSALGRTKALLRDSFASGLEAQMEMESQAIAEAAAGANGQEGFRAFLAKETPRFDG